MITNPATARREIPPTRPATAWTVAIVLAAGLAATASRANAQTLSWNNASGGSASVSGNWSPSGLPDTSTNLLFNINSALASIPLTFDAASNKSGTMLFRKETYAINITSPHATTTDVTIASASGDNATVVLESGSWSLFNTLGDVRIGNAINTVGVFTIDGLDAEFIGDDNTVLGNVGTGTLNVLDGGRFVTQSMSLGLGNATGSGTVNIDGQALAPTFTRSRLECLQSLVVGSLGTGVLNVTNGAQATCQALFVGTNSTGSGTLTIGGEAISKATLQCTLNTSVGGSSSGIIHVNAGGVLDVNAGLTLQGTGVGSGVLHVNPGGAAIAGNLIVNAGGSLDLDGGTLDVDGSTFNYNNPASHLVLGAPDAPLLTLKDTVTGMLNVVTGGRALTLGGAAVGVGIADFDVRSGSTLTIPAGDIVMGEQAGDDGGMIVNGAGSALSMAAADRAIVGQSGAGSLRFEAGANTALGGLRIGLNLGSSGSAVFDGPGTMATTNTITIGGDLASSGGTGALTVSGGADVQVASTATTDAVRIWPAGDLSVLGPSILDANKAVRVSGGEVFMDQGATLAASQFVLETGSDLFINASGTGGPAVIDALASLTGSATIDMKGDLTIGNSASPNGFSAAANSTVNLDGNTLTILDSNAAAVGTVNLSTSGGGQNGVLIAPNGVSLPSAGCKLFGSGTVKGDVHVVGSGVTINPAGSGMNIEGTLFNNPPATISGSTLRFVNGGGFNGGGTIACPVFADGLSKVHAIGNLTLGNAGLTSGTQIGGTLRVDSSVKATLLDSDGVTLGKITELATSPIIGSDALVIQSAGLTIPANGTLQGAGLLDSPSIVLAGAIKPGDLESTGAAANPVPLKFDGVVTIGSEAHYHCDLSTFSGQPLSDRLEVVSTDKLTIEGGTLEVQLLPTYTPAAGDLFDIVIAPGGINGSFATHILPLGANVVYLSDRVRISFDALCYPDCDGSGTLGIDDFICFQTFFALGDPFADCDASGTLGIDDFICFQTFFALGC